MMAKCNSHATWTASYANYACWQVRMHAERLRGRVYMYELPPNLLRQSERWMWRQWGRYGGRGCDPVYNRRIYAAQTHFDAHLMHAARRRQP